MSEIDIYTALLTIVGILLLYLKGKRRFGRLNQLGLEQYASYSQKIGAKLLDGILYSIGFVFLVTASLTFLVEHAESIPILSGSFVLFVIFLIFGTRGRSKR